MARPAPFAPAGATVTAAAPSAAEQFFAPAVLQPTARSGGRAKRREFTSIVARIWQDNIVISRAVFIACYNLVRKHEPLKGNTPTMASGLTDHVWTIKELIEKAVGTVC